MKRKGLALLIGLLVLSFVLASCAKNSNGSSSPSPSPAASPSASAAVSPSASAAASPSAGESAVPSPSASASAAPSPSLPPNAFVMGKVTAISGSEITLNVVNPAGVKTITTDNNTNVSVAGKIKTGAVSDIAVGDVITATLNGTLALKIIDDGPDVNPDPSSYISPSPSDSAAPSPSAS